MRAHDTADSPDWAFFVLVGAFGAAYSAQLSAGGQETPLVPEPAYSAIVFVLVWVGLWALGILLSRRLRTDPRV